MPQTDPEPSRVADASGRTRDHLANERTFLAWIRTSLGLIGLGFVIARMGLLLRQLALVGGNPPAHVPHGSHEFMIAGIVFLVLGTLQSAWAGRLYFRTRRAIDDGRYEPDSVTVTALTTVIVLGGMLLVGLVLWST
ncbi:YidH family protein [Singulisphaera sp. Ch08]